MESTWDAWLAANLARGCDREELIGIMVAKGYDVENEIKRVNRHYSRLPGFDHVLLEESFVLSLDELESGDVVFSMDLMLLEGHAEYRLPKENERYCFRPASLRFSGVVDARLERSGASPAIDANDETDLGHIDTFDVRDDAHYVLSGDWGKLSVLGPEPLLSIRSDTGA